MDWPRPQPPITYVGGTPPRTLALI